METKIETQRAKVAKYLKEGNTITARDAYRLCGTMRLSAIIHHLRYDRDMPIADERIYEKNTNYSKYWLTVDPALKNEMKEYMMRGNYMTTEVAKQVFECDYLYVVLNELKEEGLKIVGKRRKPLCGKEFTIWTIEK